MAMATPSPGMRAKSSRTTTRTIKARFATGFRLAGDG
jgi:hypothetical protein